VFCGEYRGRPLSPDECVREQRQRAPCPEAFLSIGTGRNVKRSLISLGILHDGRCLPLYGKDDGALGLLKLFLEVTRAGAEGGQRLDVFGKVKQDSAPVNSTLLGAIRILRPRKATSGLRLSIFQDYFFTRLVWLATHSHLPSSKTQVSVKRPRWS
jgi:hypothetical protein